MSHYSRVLVAVDLGDLSKRILQHAKTIADRFESSLHLVYCYPYAIFPDATGLLYPISPEAIETAKHDAEERLKQLLTDAERKRYRVESSVIVGDPLDRIVEYAKRERIDLIVMGTHGRTGLTHMFLGSVAERVVRTAPCPVLTIR